MHTTAMSPKWERNDGPSGLQRRLINEFQRDFPLVPSPFGELGARLGVDEATVIRQLEMLQADGVVSRVGPVIRPNTIGVSALAAMAVPADRLEAVAAVVNGYTEVNHNYERDHRLNLWFVLTANDIESLDQTVSRIEADCGLGVLVLPMLDDYYIDLGFDLDGGGKPRPANAACAAPVIIDDSDRRLLQAIQDGLPLLARPYSIVGAVLGLAEGEVRARLGALLDVGVIKRFGVIVRHHECGWRHNAMVVWDVADDVVHQAGHRLAGLESVRLCYRRPRRMPVWPYNLFCMIHGRDRDTVRDEIERVTAAAGLEGVPREVLFSVRRFKQRGARYEPAARARHAARGALA